MARQLLIVDVPTGGSVIDGVRVVDADSGRHSIVPVDVLAPSSDGEVLTTRDGSPVFERSAEATSTSGTTPTARSVLVFDPFTGSVEWSTSLYDVRIILEQLYLVLLDPPPKARDRVLELLTEAIRKVA